MVKKVLSNRGAGAVSTIVVVGLAMLIFVVAVGIGVSLLNSGDDIVAPVSESAPASSAEPEVSSKPESKPAEKGDDKSSTAPASSSAPASSTAPAASSEAPASSAAPAASSEAPASSAAPAASSAAPAASAAVSAAPMSTATTFSAANVGTSGKANIAQYQQINSDVQGWLRVPGTNIDYPVLQSAPGYDPHYYLDKNIYRQSSRNGVIYAGSTAKFGSGKTGLSKNTVMFGHNWTNVSASPRIGNASDVMFAQLTAYHHLSFAQAYPYIWFSTPSAEMSWVVFAAFYTDISFNYIDPNPSDSVHSAVISGAKARSRHIFDVDVNSSDRIITLSTCTRAYGQSDKQRFVVMARQMRDGETFTAVNVRANPNPVLPNL